MVSFCWINKLVERSEIPEIGHEHVSSCSPHKCKRLRGFLNRSFKSADTGSDLDYCIPLY